MTPTDDDIERLAHEIGERFRPERVVLFGSHARGTARSDSDVDLLVVMDYAGSSIQRSLEVLRALDYSFPLDLIVRSPGEIERRVRLGDYFLRDILREGRLLYERPEWVIGCLDRSRADP